MTDDKVIRLNDVRAKQVQAEPTPALDDTTTVIIAMQAEIARMKAEMEQMRDEAKQQRGAILRQMHYEISEARKQDRDETFAIPKLDEIARIQAQCFDNRHLSAKEKKAFGAFNLKLHVLTKSGKRREGFIPLHRLDDRRGRHLLKPIADQYLDGFSRNLVEMVERAGKMRSRDIVALISYKQQLALSIDGRPVWFDAPQAKPGDAADNAPIYSWFWNAPED